MWKVAILFLAFGMSARSCFAEQAMFSNILLERQIEALFSADRDLADVKLAVDAMVDGGGREQRARETIETLAKAAKALSTGHATSLEKLADLRRLIYEPGPWNGHRPFQYDMDDPLGEKPANRRLAHYLETRHGNCVTMPVLFVILGREIGLKLTLAEAPLHIFVKFTDDDGRT